ncbi:MAG: AMP-binding protein [Rhodopseudomonas sp.]|nr:AMP-binding protein [Rhodopseudomonas sp.]
MILRSAKDKTGQQAVGNRATLDELFTRAAQRAASPSTLALIDPPNRASFTDGMPRRLTYAEADRAISAMAAKLSGLGLPLDSVVAIQLPNTVEAIVTLLAVLRAGLIAAPLPLLWRKHEIVAGLSRIGAKAIVTTARIADVAHAEVAMTAAAELFPVRYICAFGRNLPDGIVPLDDIFDEDATVEAPAQDPNGRPGDHAADHVAVVTLDMTSAGIVPVARNHMELLAGGTAIYLEAGAPRDGRMLSTIPPTSFAGIAATVLVWLAGGGTLSLHHGFDAATFAAQIKEQDKHPPGHQARGYRGGVVVLPGPALAPLARAGLLDADDQMILALWRSPEQLATTSSWNGPARLADISCFGEVGLLAARRGSDNLPADHPLGRIGAPRSSGTIAVAETARSRSGTLQLRGPMVPVHAFPPGAELGSDPRLDADGAGYIDTGFTCRLDGAHLTVTGPPGGLATIGGYRFRSTDVDDQAEAADPDAIVAALPDGVLALRLAGSATDPAAVRGRLADRGVNPLIADAFRPRGRTANETGDQTAAESESPVESKTA